MSDPIISIGAIKQCMEDLGFHLSRRQTFDAEATIFNPKNRLSGFISVTFNSNWHSGDGPFIEVDDVIKSFGITYTSFKPQWQDFKYNQIEKKLIISDDGYQFSLSF